MVRFSSPPMSLLIAIVSFAAACSALVTSHVSDERNNWRVWAENNYTLTYCAVSGSNVYCLQQNTLVAGFINNTVIAVDAYSGTVYGTYTFNFGGNMSFASVTENYIVLTSSTGGGILSKSFGLIFQNNAFHLQWSGGAFSPLGYTEPSHPELILTWDQSTQLFAYLNASTGALLTTAWQVPGAPRVAWQPVQAAVVGQTVLTSADNGYSLKAYTASIASPATISWQFSSDYQIVAAFDLGYLFVLIDGNYNVYGINPNNGVITVNSSFLSTLTIPPVNFVACNGQLVIFNGTEVWSVNLLSCTSTECAASWSIAYNATQPVPVYTQPPAHGSPLFTRFNLVLSDLCQVPNIVQVNASYSALEFFDINQRKVVRSLTYEYYMEEVMEGGAPCWGGDAALVCVDSPDNDYIQAMPFWSNTSHAPGNNKNVLLHTSNRRG